MRFIVFLIPVSLQAPSRFRSTYRRVPSTARIRRGRRSVGIPPSCSSQPTHKLRNVPPLLCPSSRWQYDPCARLPPNSFSSAARFRSAIPRREPGSACTYLRTNTAALRSLASCGAACGCDARDGATGIAVASWFTFAFFVTFGLGGIFGVGRSVQEEFVQVSQEFLQHANLRFQIVGRVLVHLAVPAQSLGAKFVEINLFQTQRRIDCPTYGLFGAR